MEAITLSLVFAGPWLVGIALMWVRPSRHDRLPISMSEAARRRLWST